MLHRLSIWPVRNPDADAASGHVPKPCPETCCERAGEQGSERLVQTLLEGARGGERAQDAGRRRVLGAAVAVAREGGNEAMLRVLLEARGEEEEAEDAEESVSSQPRKRKAVAETQEEEEGGRAHHGAARKRGAASQLSPSPAGRIQVGGRAEAGPSVIMVPVTPEAKAGAGVEGGDKQGACGERGGGEGEGGGVERVRVAEGRRQHGSVARAMQRAPAHL
eukprot:439773-Rhodomonas_salina.1